MPKQYVRLAGTRATGRACDDRVGDAALVLALRHLDRAALRHEVIFIWSVREEIGLEGAAVAARAPGPPPQRAAPIDTFATAALPPRPPHFPAPPPPPGTVPP